MLSLHPMRWVPERRDRVNAFAVFAVNEHLEFLREEAARNRAKKPAKPSLRNRIAAVSDKVRLNVATSTYEMSSILPKLEDYPYRS
jgi:hypothetical protein